MLEAEIAAFSADACAALGPTAVNTDETVLSTAFDTIGWRFNIVEGTVAPSLRAVFIKLIDICVFNIATPDDVNAGSLVKVRQA